MRWLALSRTGQFLSGAVASALLVLAVFMLSEARSESSYIWPTFGNVWESFRDTWLFENVRSDVVPSLTRMFAGFGLAIVAGVAGGLLLGASSVADALANPVVNFLRSLPAVTLLPPAIVLLGIGDAPKISVIAFVCAWPIVLNTRDGVRELDSVTMASASVYGITGLRRFWLVVLPALGPRIFAGMRVSLSIAILLMVTSEMIASTNGIGYVVIIAQQQFAINDMWAGVVLLGLLGVLLNFALSFVERYVLRWNRPDKA